MRALLLPLAAALSLTACPARHTYPVLLARPRVQPTAVVFHNVRVFTATDAGVLDAQDVTVVGDRIVAVAPTGGALPAGAQSVDGAGRTLLPGFVDAHAHLTGSAAPPWHVTFPDVEHNARALLAAGVTTTLDVGGRLSELNDFAAKVARGEALSPRFTFAGPLLTPSGGYPGSMIRELFGWPIGALAADRFVREVRTPEEAREAIGQHQDRGARHVKLAVAQVPLETPVFEAAMVKASVDEAHRRGLKVVAHIDSAEHALLAARAGVDALIHGVHLGELTVAQAQELKALGVAVAPTLVVFDRIEQLAEFRFAPTAQEQRLYPADYLAVFAPEVARKQSLPDGLLQWLRKVQADKPHRLEAVRRLFEAGVPLLVGSDASGSTGCLAGGAFLDELRLLVEAGVPPAEVLLGATSRAALFIAGDQADFGVVAVGKRADLVLVTGQPDVDPSHLPLVERVMQSGVLLDTVP